MNVEPTTKSDDEAFPVWTVNWPSFRLFLDCETQWRMVATMAGLFHTGIDYTAAVALLRLAPLAIRRRSAELLDDLRIMEGEALKAFAEARDG